MSVLLRRSLLVLALLFGLLFAVGSAVLWHMQVSIWYAIVFAVFVVGLQYLIGPYIIGVIFKISWMSPTQVSPELAQFLVDACRRDGIPVPRFGVIEDGNPNAFTYGHTPGDARLVVTRGLIDMLSAEELQAVVGHELGHIKHWDFVVMTIASLVPLILYYIYVWVRYSDRRDRSGYTWAIAISAYIAYIISQYIALFLSRVREYYADYHAAKMTRNPNALATALVTIAYGLAKAEPPKAEEGDDKKKTPVFDRTSAISSLSFFNGKGASHFAMAASDVSGNFSPETMKKAMRWDLYNPWAKWFELNSTHPLPAKRIREIEKYAGPAGQTPACEFAAAPQSYTDKFLVDVVVAMLPYIGIVLGLVLGAMNSMKQINNMIGGIGLAIMFFGLGMFVRTMFAYRGDFRQSDIVSLVTETEVSHIRPIPAEIKGKIIGRGVPGLFWSSDLVIQDENGFTTLIYRQPLEFLNFLFGWLKAEKLVGREATVRGWFRRGPGPYLEMKEATFDNGESVHCYYYHFVFALSVLMTLIGLVWAFLVVQ